MRESPEVRKLVRIPSVLHQLDRQVLATVWALP